MGNNSSPGHHSDCNDESDLPLRSCSTCFSHSALETGSNVYFHSFMPYNNRENLLSLWLVSLTQMNRVKKPIYLDYHSTTPVDPVVLNVMLPFYSEHFG